MKTNGKSALERQLEQLIESRNEAAKRIYDRMASDKPLSADDHRSLGGLVERGRGLLKMLAAEAADLDDTPFEGAMLGSVLARVGSPLRGAGSDELVFLRKWRQYGHPTFDPTAGLFAQMLLSDSKDATRTMNALPTELEAFRVQVPGSIGIDIPIEGGKSRSLRYINVVRWLVLSRQDEALPSVDMRPMADAQGVVEFAEGASFVVKSMKAVRDASKSGLVPALTIRGSDGRGVSTAVTVVLNGATVAEVLADLDARAGSVRPSVGGVHLAMARIALHFQCWLTQKDRVGRPVWHAGMRSESRSLSMWRVGSGVKASEGMLQDISSQFTAPDGFVAPTTGEDQVSEGSGSAS